MEIFTPQSVAVVFAVAVIGVWLFTEDANPLEIALGLAFGVFAFAFIALGSGLKKLRNHISQAKQPAAENAPSINVDNTAAIQVPLLSDAPKAPHAMREPSQTPWAVADYIINVRFNDAFSASVSVFNSQKITRRKIRAISPAAGILMKNIYGREGFNLPEYELSEGRTVEEAVMDTERIGIEFMENLLTKPAEYFQPEPAKGEDPKPAMADPESIARSVAILRGELADANTPTQRIQPAEPPANSEAVLQRRFKRKAIGVTVGIVTEMGMRKMLYKGGAMTFEAQIQRDDGEFVSFRGVRLNELFTEYGIKTGDRVEIESLGTTTSDTGDGEKRTRNEYKVKVLETA